MTIPDIGKREIIDIPIAALKPYDKNPRKHPPAQIAMLKAGISRFGFTAPTLVTPDYEIIAGHGRLIAAIELGMTTIPALVLPHLNEADRRAYRIADNALVLKGEWSIELLKEELEFVFKADMDFSAVELGFDVGEIDFFLGSAAALAVDDDSGPPEDRNKPSVTTPGDLWSVGDHRILCGDALDPLSFHRLLDGELADVVISDMPWNRKIDGHVGGKGAIKHPEFAMASGEMSPEQFGIFTREVLDLQARFSRPGALNYQFIDWPGVTDMVMIGRDIYDSLVNLCVWVKPNGGMGSLYRSRHELVCVFRVKGGRHDNFVQLGKHGRNRTNVWEFAAPSGFGSERDNLSLHPTCKNIDMIAQAIMDCTKRKAIVLDAFLGSGTTVLAAARTGRRGRGIEIDPYYVDVGIRRLQAETGLTAKLADGRSFTDIEQQQKEASRD